MGVGQYQPGGNELADGLPEAQQFSHDRGTDVGIAGLGKEQEGFDARYVAVEVGNGFFVFKVGDGAYSAQDGRGPLLSGFVDGEVVVGDDFDARFLGKQFLQHLDSLFRREEAAFGVVDANGDDDFVEDVQRSSRYRLVSQREGVEGARVEGNFFRGLHRLQSGF